MSVQSPCQYGNLPYNKEEQSKWRTAAEVFAVGLCTIAFLITGLSICTVLLGRSALGSRDFVEYWASGQLLANHINPYSPAAILRVEHTAGLAIGVPPIIMPNPPLSLPLILPLGFLSARIGNLVWSVLLLASGVASVQMARKIQGASASRIELLGYSFAPALLALAAGQISLLVLFGVVLFLRFHRDKPLLAGAALWLCCLKPHLFLPFGVVVIAWSITTRRYKLLSGAATALTLSASAAFVLDRSAWQQYLRTMTLTRIDKIPNPCLTNALRRIISADSMWLQYVPIAVACLWALSYFKKHRDEWDWAKHGSLVLLVSVLFAPYTWLNDQCIFIPALMHGAYSTRSRRLILSLALASTAIELAPLFVREVTHSMYYAWTAPFWLTWYIVATGTGSKAPPLSASRVAIAKVVPL